MSPEQQPSCEAIKRRHPKANDGSYTIFSSSSVVPVRSYNRYIVDLKSHPTQQQQDLLLYS